MFFLKNHELRIRTVNTKKNEEDTTPTMEEVLNPDSVALIEEAGRKMIKHLALTVVGMIVVVKVVDALCEIGVDKSKKSDHE